MRLREPRKSRIERIMAITHLGIKSRRPTSLISPIPDGDANAYISYLPDDCLTYIFNSLGSLDRESCSLVCRRWLHVEGQSRNRLSLTLKSDCLLPVIPFLFTRFDAVTTLALRCDPPSKFRSVLIDDDALVLISLHCRNLTHLNLHSCTDVTDIGMVNFAVNCKGLKELHCDSCNFGAKGMNAVLDHCSFLEKLFVEHLNGLGLKGSPIGPGVAAYSLNTICIKDLVNGYQFGPLILGSKNLRTLKIVYCGGDWDKVFEDLTTTNLVEIHLETLRRLSDIALLAISKNCSNLEILHLVDNPNCTDLSLAYMANHCKLLREVHHIVNWNISDEIGDEGGVTVIAERCPNLEELILFGIHPTTSTFDLLAANCQKLERLAVCWSHTFDDEVISSITAKCKALKNLSIMGCSVSNDGLKTMISNGCPHLVRLTIMCCWLITYFHMDFREDFKAWLKVQPSRGSLVVNFNTNEIDPDPFWTKADLCFRIKNPEYQAF